jgi:hypothetical protein
MKNLRVATLLLVAAVGCGDDGGSSKTPDAMIITPDMAVDAPARVCTGATAGTVDFLGSADGVIVWGGPLTSTIGGGNTVTYQYELYDGIETSLMGTIDLTAGNQANYKTCAVCVRAIARDAQGKIVKQYFQSAGSVTLTEDPFTNSHLKATFSNVQLEEVTLAQDFTSTPVAGGECASFGNVTVDKDRVPNAWTCPHADWDTGTATGTSCNCMCGVPDPDCSIATAPVAGCTTATPACYNDACVAVPANDTCASATALTIATPVNGTTIGASASYNSGLEATTCTGYTQAGRDVVYSVDLAANQAITVTLSNPAADFDPSIALIGPGAATLCDASPIATCVKGADAGGPGDGETFTYTATTAGTYFIIVDSYYAVPGTFTLNVTSP